MLAGTRTRFCSMQQLGPSSRHWIGACPPPSVYPSRVYSALCSHKNSSANLVETLTAFSNLTRSSYPAAGLQVTSSKLHFLFNGVISYLKSDGVLSCRESLFAIGHALPEDGGQEHVAQEYLTNFVDMFIE